MKMACVAIAKDEDRYLEEWIRYHTKLGFDDIFVFQNNWRYRDSFKFLRNPYVRFIPFDGKQMQNPCYNRFILEHHGEYDFIAFIDIDEFVVVKNGTLKEWLSGLDDKECVYVNWRVFGDNGLVLEDGENDFSVLKRFTRCDDRLSRYGKNFLNTKLVKDTLKFHDPHIVVRNTNPISLPPLYDTNGFPLRKPWLVDNDKEQCVEIFHYRNKTYQECLEKRFGMDDAYWETVKCPYRTDLKTFDSVFERFNTNKVENTAARDFLYGKRS